MYSNDVPINTDALFAWYESAGYADAVTAEQERIELMERLHGTDMAAWPQDWDSGLF